MLLGVRDALVEHLERPYDTADVVGVNLLRALLVAVGQKAPQGLGPLVGGERLVTFPRAAMGLARGEIHLVNDGVEVEAGAAA